MGNKNDDPARKQVDTQDAMRFGESVGVRVFETSAKENINVEKVITLPVCVNIGQLSVCRHLTGKSLLRLTLY